MRGRYAAPIAHKDREQEINLSDHRRMMVDSPAVDQPRSPVIVSFPGKRCELRSPLVAGLAAKLDQRRMPGYASHVATFARANFETDRPDRAQAESSLILKFSQAETPPKALVRI
jgi:hypothetical protein